MGQAFMLEGGDCLASIKELNANNIWDPFRVLIQMGGERMEVQFSKPRSDPFVEKNGVKLLSYRGDNINGDDFDEKSRIYDPHGVVSAYTQFVVTLTLFRAFANAAMQRVSQWNLDFSQHSEHGDMFLSSSLNFYSSLFISNIVLNYLEIKFTQVINSCYCKLRLRMSSLQVVRFFGNLQLCSDLRLNCHNGLSSHLWLTAKLQAKSQFPEIVSVNLTRVD